MLLINSYCSFSISLPSTPRATSAKASSESHKIDSRPIKRLARHRPHIAMMQIPIPISSSSGTLPPAPSPPALFRAAGMQLPQRIIKIRNRQHRLMSCVRATVQRPPAESSVGCVRYLQPLIPKRQPIACKPVQHGDRCRHRLLPCKTPADSEIASCPPDVTTVRRQRAPRRQRPPRHLHP